MKLGKQLEAATERIASFICIVGPESIDGNVQLRMASYKGTKVVPIDRIFDFLPIENWGNVPERSEPPNLQ